MQESWLPTLAIMDYIKKKESPRWTIPKFIKSEPDTALASWESEGILTSSEAQEASLNYIELLLDVFNQIKTKIYSEKIDILLEEIQKFKKTESTTIKLNILETKRLRNPLDVIIEADEAGFIARTVDFPLFGYGDDRFEAIDALKSEIESLYFDLMEDDNFTEDWKGIKDFLKEQIVES